MADTFIELNPGTAGVKIDGRSMAGGDIREVVVIGDGTTAANVAPVDATAGLKVDLGSDNDVTVTSGTVTASNLPTTVDTNSGNKGASTLRVVLATDQPALTAKLLVTPDSIALPANQSCNTAQINGATPLMGAGNTGTGSLRVTIATDQAQLSNKLLVTPDLPTGASTAAKQPALGTAGTASADVISVQGIASMTALQTGGNIAHDGVDAGNPHKIGGRAIAHGTNPTAVAAADRTDWLFNRAGVPFVIGGHPNVATIAAAYTSGQTDVAVITVGAGAKIVVTAIEVICANANTVDTAVYVGFGTANTPTTAGVVLTHPGIAAGSGVAIGNGAGMIAVGADNEDLRITCGAPTTGSIRIRVSYYTIES